MGTELKGSPPIQITNQTPPGYCKRPPVIHISNGGAPIFSGLARGLPKAVSPSSRRGKENKAAAAPPLDYNRSLPPTRSSHTINNNSMPRRSSYESSTTAVDRDVLHQPILMQVLRRATAKLVYVCRHGKMPETAQQAWEPTPPAVTARAKSTRSVVVMTYQQYQWMQRAHFVSDTVEQLTRALNAVSGVSPESVASLHYQATTPIPTHSAVAAFAQNMVQMSTDNNSDDGDDQQQTALDNRALLYLQQLLVEQGLTMAPTTQALTQQLVHPDMTRRATQFLVRLYKLRKAVLRAKKAKRVADYDAVLLQAHVLLQEFLFTNANPRDSSPSPLPPSGGGNEAMTAGTDSTTRSASLRDHTIRQQQTNRIQDHRHTVEQSCQQNLVQHILGGYLGDMCVDKQVLVLHVQANVTRQVESFWGSFWGSLCCCFCPTTTILAGAQAQVNFLLDMTRHAESTDGTQYAGMFLVHARPQRISPNQDYYEAFQFLAARTLWDATRDNLDTPVAAAAPIQTHPEMVGETGLVEDINIATAATATIKRKKIVRKKVKSTDPEGEKKRMASGHSVETADSTASGEPHKRLLNPGGRRPSGDGASGGPLRMASTGRAASKQDPSGHMSKPPTAAVTKKGQSMTQSSQRSTDKANTRKTTSGDGQKDSTPSAGPKPLRKPSGGGGAAFIVDLKDKGNTTKKDRRKSGDTAPSFYEGSEGEEEEEVESIAPTVLASQIIPEIEKMGKLGEEVAAILRSPSKHTRSDIETATKTSRSSGKMDEESVLSSDSQPIKLRPKRPPTADSSVGESVVLFQPPGDKISATSVRASDFNQPTTPTTAAYSSTTGSTTVSTFAGSSASGSASYQAALPVVAEENPRSKSAPSAGRNNFSDPAAHRAPSQREQIERKLQQQQKPQPEEIQKDSKSPRKSNKKDSV